MRAEIDRRTLGVFLLCVITVIGGCATATVDSTVTGDEAIQEYHLEIEMTPVAYNASRQEAIDRGYSPSEPFRDVLRTDLDLVRSQLDTIDYEVVNESDGNKTISLTLRGYEPPESGNVTLTKRGRDDDTLVYEDRLFTNDTVTGSAMTGRFSDETSIEYTVEMPHEITNTTADSSSGTTATWTDSGESNGTVHVYAEVDLPLAPNAAFEHDPSEPTAGESVTFDAIASTDDEAIDTYRWDFDDDDRVDETTSSPTVTYEYSEGGQYTVRLVVVDEDGLRSDPVTETVFVRSPPSEDGEDGGDDGSDGDDGEDGNGEFPGWLGMGGIGLAGFTIGFLTGNARDQDVQKKSMGFLAIIFGGSGLFGLVRSPTIGWLVVGGTGGVLCGVVVGTAIRKLGFSFAP